MEKVYKKAFELGCKKYPLEACGLVVNNDLFECKNLAESPETNFLIDPKDYMEAAKLGEIQAVWHTHCELPGVPSLADKAGCESSELPWFIVGIRQGENGFERYQESLINPTGWQSDYENRPYVFGTFDCYTLVADYYEREFKIKLERRPEWWVPDHDFFLKEFKGQGFRDVTLEPIQDGDVVLMQIRGPSANHIGIYTGNDMLLHHCVGRFSRSDIYGTGYWNKHTVRRLRHETKC